MMVGRVKRPHGDVIYEIPGWKIRPSRFIPVFLLIVVVFTGAIVKVPSYGVVIPGIIAIYVMYTVSFSLNGRFGVYSKGIFPLRKAPIFLPSVPWSVFVPYTDIAKIDLKGKKAHPLGSGPYVFSIRTVKGRTYTVNSEDLLKILGFQNEIDSLNNLLLEVMDRMNASQGLGHFSPSSRPVEVGQNMRDRSIRMPHALIEGGQWMILLGGVLGILWAEFGVVSWSSPLLLSFVALSLSGILAALIGSTLFNSLTSSRSS